MTPARVWKETIRIPTYPVGKPDRNPMFLEHRVYQGASGRVYPHTVIDTVSDAREMQTYTALCLENEYLYVVVLPELGGRVQRALDKTNGYDFVYYNQVIKPAMVGLAGPWISGGIEFNWPQHHRPSTFDPVQWAIETGADGSASVIVGEIETMYRTKGQSRMTLYPGKAYLEIQNRVFNRTDQPQTFMWWANPAVPVNEHTRSIFPPDVYAVMDHGKRDVSAFPIARGVYYKTDYSAGVDISRYKNLPVPTSYMAHHSDYDFLGNYDDEKHAGLLHIADHHIAPGKKQWTWGSGEFGKAWDRNLTDEDGPYIELMTGCFTDNQPDFTFLMPREEKRFTQYFMPYKEVGAVKNATCEAAVGLEREGARAVVTVYTTAAYPDAVVRVWQGGTMLADRHAGLSPERPCRMEVLDPGERLSVEVRDAENRLLVCYRETRIEEKELPKPAEAIPPAADVETTEKLYLYGLHIEQYHHATWDAADYYCEGLRRDPEDIRLNNAYGKLLLKRGLVEESIRYFQRATQAATVKNPNPYDGECFFNLGVAFALTNNTDAAYEAFFKAAWSGAWQSAAYECVGCVDLARGDWQKAEQHLRESLAHGQGNMLARNALTLLLRKTGRTAEAAQTARETLRMDPINLGAARELSLAEGAPETWSEGIDKNPNPYIELALEYARTESYADAADVLAEGWKRNQYPLLAYYLAYFTRDCMWLEQAETVCADGCFPHRPEDRIVLDNALQHQSEAPRAHYYLGDYWYDKRQTNRAAAHWETAVRQDSTFPTAHRNLALAYYNQLNRPADSLREMETAFRLNETDARVFMELMILKQKLRHPAAECAAQMEKYRQLVEKRDDLKILYVTLLNTLGRYPDALGFIRAHRFHPWEGGEGKVSAQWHIALVMMAQMDIRHEKYGSALEKLEEATGSYPENLAERRLPNTRDNDVWYWIGCCREAMGEQEQAKAAFLRAGEGSADLTDPLYYNDQPPESLFYQGLANRKLKREAEANALFGKLRAYAQKHMADERTIDYFAVSLPDMQIFHDDSYTA